MTAAATQPPRSGDATDVQFSVPGIPATQGSTRAYIRGGRAVVTHANEKTIPWRHTIGHTANLELEGRYAAPGSPVTVTVDFVLPRPASHWLKTGGLRKTAPRYPRLDLDKLVRAVLDALTGVAWHDDSQVTDLIAGKGYVTDPAVQPGARITLSADWTRLEDAP